jgi:acetyl-CoA hydrolase/succinyl-CoA:acetate CoA-transferase
MPAHQAAAFIHDGMVVGASGFTRSGDSKAVLVAFAKKAECDQARITLMTGASLGHGTDGALATAGAIAMRLPFQSDPVMRTIINQGKLSYIDENLSETAAHIRNGFLPPIDIAIVEAASIEADGSIVPTTSVGNSAIFVQQAKQVIIEITRLFRWKSEGFTMYFCPKTRPVARYYRLRTSGSALARMLLPAIPGRSWRSYLPTSRTAPPKP